MDRCLRDTIDTDICIFVETIADRIQKPILTAVDNIITPGAELAIGLPIESSGWDSAGITANSERRNYLENSASFENVCDRNENIS